jgi:5'-3' exonuclease
MIIFLYKYQFLKIDLRLILSINTMTTLLIDLSYFIFYRYYATYNWYKKQNDSKDVNILKDNLFLDKYDKIFEQTICELQKKHEISWTNVYFAKDCPREEIWRVNYYKEYKQTREERLDTFDKEIFKHTIVNLIPKLQTKYGGCYLIHEDHLESDDIIAIIKNYIREHDSEYEIVIITNDNDYVQLIDDYTLVVNLQGRDLKTRINCSPEEYLQRKIILGDKSDNIPSIGKKIGEKTAEKLACNLELLQDIFDKKPDTKQNYDLNELLISFQKIPTEFRTKVINSYIRINC